MAGWVIDQCVTGERIGGGVTKNLKHATDWVLDPTADFEQTMRKIESLPILLSLNQPHSYMLPSPYFSSPNLGLSRIYDISLSLCLESSIVPTTLERWQ